MPSECIFSLPHPPLLHIDAVLGSCSGSSISLINVRSLKSPLPLHGAKDCLDLLLLRGGRVTNWNYQPDNQHQVTQVLTMGVCERHLSTLITDWDRNKVGNRTNKDGKPICSLPGMKHRRNKPVTSKLLTKIDVLPYMKNIGALCQIGSPICTTHFNALINSKWEFFELLNPNSLDLPSSDDLTNDLFDSPQDPLYIAPPSSKDATPEPEIDRVKALRSILAEFGIHRLTSDKPWCKEEERTRRRKVQAVIDFLDELFKISAGEEWETMKTEFQQKMMLVKKDERIESIMNSIGQCLEDTNDKTVRLSVLKLVTGVFSEKEITAATGASRYLIRHAKLTELDETRSYKKFIREKYNKENVQVLLRFLARPDILTTLPNVSRKFKLGNGSESSIASVARLFSYREIYQLYGRYCEELGKLQGLSSASDLKEFVRVHSLGYATAYRIMEVIAPNRKLRMSCVDSFQVNAFDAFDDLSNIVDELELLSEIDSVQCIELRRRIRVSKNFTFGDMRLHITKESSVSSHCWTHALSDNKDARFASTCSHAHDSVCAECTESMNLPSILKGVVRLPLAVATKNGDQIRHRLGRMAEICEESDELIRSYRQHLIRCVASEHDRRAIIDNLEDNHALLVIDYAMKLLPTDTVEKQSQWYAKAGISYHMTATVARINGELASHSFSHVSSISKQDATAVSGILHHSLKILKENGITHVHVRSDNAGTYHCAGLIASLLNFSSTLKITVISHIFSEPQYGKGRADREISLCKGKLNSYIDSGNSACTPSEIIDGFTNNILLKGCSFYLIEVEKLTENNAELVGIKQFSSFRFDAGVGVRVKRHDAIGEGMIVLKENLPPIEFKTTIDRSRGYLSGTEHFWKFIGTKRSSKERESNEIVESEDDQFRERKVIHCTDLLCRGRFKTAMGLENHLTREKHEYYKEAQTVVDYAVQSFASLVETTEEAHIAVQQASILPISGVTNTEENKTGWALRRSDRSGPLNPEVKKEVEKLVRIQLDGGRRAEAREIEKQLRELKLNDGSYLFSLKKCITESQIKSQISRILTEEKKRKEALEKLNKEDEKEQTLPKTQGRKRKEKESTDDHTQKKRGRPPKKSQVKSREDLSEKKNEETQIEEEAFDSLGLIVDEISKNIDGIFDRD